MDEKIAVKGFIIDEQTRCKHYHSVLDIIAIKFKCCNEYYPCYYCHLEATDHISMLWRKTEFDEKAILCGACFNELTIVNYKACNYECPVCKTAFNPLCLNHDHLYFEQ